MYKLCSETEDVTKINIEKKPDSEYVHNSRGQKLHVHSYWPEEENLIAIVISLHGMGCHSNRPMQRYMAESFNKSGLGYICLDFHGHGYSDGLRGLVDSPEYLLDDVMSLLNALYNDSPSFSSTDYRLNRRLVSAPFFLMGHSMGGSTAISLGHMLSDRELVADPPLGVRQPISKIFRGCLLLCPAIDIKMPSIYIVTVLDYLVVPLFPNCSVPEMLVSRKSSQNLIWSNKMFQDYVSRDGYPGNPKGLSYGDPVRFQTASTLVKLAARLKSLLSEIRFPFIVFHDPLEQIVLVHGSERLIKDSLTLPGRKSIVMVEGGLHDLLSNNFTSITEKSIEWIMSEMKMGHHDLRMGSDAIKESKRPIERDYASYFLFFCSLSVVLVVLRSRITDILYWRNFPSFCSVRHRGRICNCPLYNIRVKDCQLLSSSILLVNCQSSWLCCYVA